MTIFMGARTNYLLDRYKWHSKFSWFALFTTVAIGAAVFADVNVEDERLKRNMAIPLGVTAAAALVSGNGRKTIGRGVKEVFYGCLFTFTGVFHGDGKGGRST